MLVFWYVHRNITKMSQIAEVKNPLRENGSFRREQGFGRQRQHRGGISDLHICSEVKQIEKRNPVLTSETQIERLTRSGSSDFSLNPFGVLQIDPEVTVKK